MNASGVDQPRAAALPMYRIGAAAPAADLFWAGLAAKLRELGLGDAPPLLARPDDSVAFAATPGLLLTQTCGYPLMTTLRDRVRLVATPVYDAEGCDGADYRSALVVARDDPRPALDAFRGATAAINNPDSHSGMNALRATVAPLARSGRFFAATVMTSSHLRSLHAVASGAADIAAIDCVSLALAIEADPDLAARIRTLQWTAPAPSLPFVTAWTTSDEDLFRLRIGLAGAIADRDLALACRAMRLSGITVLPDSAYRRVLVMEDDAHTAGYPTIL